MKKYTSMIMSLLLALSLAGCGSSDNGKSDASPSPAPEQTEEAAKTDDPGKQEETPVVKNVNLREVLGTLHVSTDKLGITEDYSKLSDIKDGSIDPELVGAWTIPGVATYTFGADGKATAEVKEYDIKNEVTYTCLKLNGFNIIAEEVGVTEDSDTQEKTVVTLTSYKVDNGVLYMTSVEDLEAEYQSYISPIQVMYKEDASGSTKTAVESNPIDIASFNGSWEADDGRAIVIKDGKLTANGAEYAISLDQDNKLVAEKDGASTTYPVSLAYRIYYKDSKIDEEGYFLTMSYIGKDENDKPNLIDVLVDWHKEYDWNEFRYNQSFEEK